MKYRNFDLIVGNYRNPILTTKEKDAISEVLFYLFRNFLLFAI